MLRSAVKSTILNRLKSKASLGVLASRSQSSEKSNPQVNMNESSESVDDPNVLPKKEESERLSQFRNKLKEDMAAMEMNRYNITTPIEDDPLPPWPDNVNPHTGEVGGPRGPEPTRYGDWERKGICVDF